MKTGGAWILMGLCVGLSSVTTGSELIDELSKEHPTPCLDAISPIYLSLELREIAANIVDGYGRRSGAPASWAPGAHRRDKALEILYQAMRSDRAVVDAFRSLDSKGALLHVFMLGNADDHEFWAEFYRTEAGKVHWNYIIDGASCAGAIKSITRHTGGVPSDDQSLLRDWSQRLDSKARQFTLAYNALPQEERIRFDTANADFQKQLPANQAEKNRLLQNYLTTESGMAPLRPILKRVQPELAELIRAEIAEHATHPQ